MATIFLVTAVAIFGAVAGILAIVIVGIHRDDRAKTLTGRPNSTVEAATRRLLGVGIRASSHDESEEV